LDAEGAVKMMLESTDIPLGFLPQHAFGCSHTLQLEAGDTLALITDGIMESERPDEHSFGMQRAIEFIRSHRRESAQEIVNGLYHAVRDFSNGMPQLDDITSVVCKVNGIKK
jgi:sigma-B regulation protein RsbU (phosphoserine phosphatase)